MFVMVGDLKEKWVAAIMIGGARVRLNRWQHAAVVVGSAVGALLDPRRADLIAALGETTGKPAFERVVQRMKSSPEGRIFSWPYCRSNPV
ncbi:putative ubiquinone biosynthesis protein Coq4 [Rosa chinensis]|uniref:Putative ubiquinone biosynthesis protein Coq4 n=1 Tax=Rosa chinensis TaxID=74649 RepID=A0A2P6P2X5_ROSCH|nr:putative ubiquinone biosynthesis protein Coq4 [Rosa chinensis]